MTKDPPSGVRARAMPSDESAWAKLLQSQTIALRRWAHRRLPRWARTIADTSDLVQEAVLKTLGRLDLIQVSAPGALQAYLRRCVLNQIADEHRKVARRGTNAPLDLNAPSSLDSPLQEAIGSELEENYKKGLARLRASDQLLVVGHVELGYSLEQLACATHRNVAAVRVALRRALIRLASELEELSNQSPKTS